MCRLIRNSRSQYTPSQSSRIILYLCSFAALTFSACATIRQEGNADQYIRVENQNLFHIRAYVAFETSPNVRVLLGTVDPNGHEEFRVPSVFRGTRALVIRCEKGRPGAIARLNEYFETAFVSIPRSSTLVVTIRDPMRYSVYSVLSIE